MNTEEHFLIKIKKNLDFVAIIGMFYILAYQIKTLRNIGKMICQYMTDWLFTIDMTTIKSIYMIIERIFIVVIVIALVYSIIMEIISRVSEHKLKKEVGISRFERSLFRYLQDTSVSRCYLLSGKWGSGKTYDINQFFNKYYKYAKTKVYRVSCFGLSSRKELIEEINNTIENKDNSFYATIIKALQFLPVIGEAISKFLKKSYGYDSVKEGSIFIFDDFERITSRTITSEMSSHLYRQSPFMLNNVYGRNSHSEFEDIKKELKSIDKAFLQVEEYIAKHSEREDYDKYIAVIGLINELIEFYGMKVIIICNSDILGEKFVHDVLRSKLNCIEYKKYITPDMRKAVIDNILNSRTIDDEDKQQCINEYIVQVKENIEDLLLDTKFADLRLFGGLLEAFIDTAVLFEKEALTKEFLNSLLNSILIMHLAYYNGSLDKMDSYVNGANIEFLLNLFGGPVDTSNLIHISYNSDEMKWVDVRISGYWIFNLSFPNDADCIHKSWKIYKYSELESDMVSDCSSLERADDYSLIHLLLFQIKQKEDKFGNLDCNTYVSKSLEKYDLTDEKNVEYIFGIVSQVFTGRFFSHFQNILFENVAQKYGNGAINQDTYLCREYKKFLEKRNQNNV